MNYYYYPQCETNLSVWKLCVIYHEECPQLIVFENDNAWTAKVLFHIHSKALKFSFIKFQLTKEDLQAQPKYNSSNYEDQLKGFLTSPPENAKFQFNAGCFKILLPLEGDQLHMVFFTCRLTQAS